MGIQEAGEWWISLAAGGGEEGVRKEGDLYGSCGREGMDFARETKMGIFFMIEEEGNIEY